MNVLSIHSSVALGHVGNSGIAFALRRLGHEVWPVDTVVFSNHPAHGGFRGRVTPAAEISELIEGLAERGALARCDAVLTGYLGAADQAPAVVDAVRRVRNANPRAIWLCDPVIGDDQDGVGRVYVKPGIAAWLRDDAVRHADILTPNAFELAFLSGGTTDTIDAALAAIDSLRRHAQRPSVEVIATGLRLRERTAAGLTVLMVGGLSGAAWRIEAPEIERPAHGAGDVFAALLLGRRLARESLVAAASGAAASLSGIVAATPSGAADLALVAAQDEIIAPTASLAAQRLR